MVTKQQKVTKTQVAAAASEIRKIAEAMAGRGKKARTIMRQWFQQNEKEIRRKATRGDGIVAKHDSSTYRVGDIYYKIGIGHFSEVPWWALAALYAALGKEIN